MLVVFINVFIILILAILLSLIINEELYKTIPTVVISIPLIIVFIGYFVSLDIAIWSIYIFTFLFLVVTLIKRYKNIEQIKRFVINNKFVILTYFIVAFYFLLVNYNRPAWGWDEFSHWARVVKNMNFTRHLNRSSDVAYLMFPHYPPNVSTFLYFFDYQRVFSEWQLYYAQSLYTVMLVFPIAFYIGKYKKNIHKIVLLLFAILLPTALYPFIYISLFVDGIMGLLLGYAIIEYVFNNNLILKFVNIALALSALTLTKDAGTVLAIIFITILFFDICFKRNNRITKNSNKGLSFKHCIVLLCFVIFAYFSYKLYLNISGVESLNYAKIYSENILQLQTWQITTIKNFYHEVFDYNFGNAIKLSVVNIIVLLLLLIAVLHNLRSKRVYYNTNIIIFTIAGFLIYLFLLLCTYIFRFDEYEATRLMSFDRYISTYLLFLFIVVLSIVCVVNDKMHNIIIMFIIFSLLFNPLQGLFRITIGAIDKREIKRETQYFENISNNIKKHIGINDTVSLVSIGNQGYNSLRIIYCLGPVYKTNYMYEPSTTVECNYSNVMTPNDYMAKLKEQNVVYVYLDEINQKFVDGYSILFEKYDDIQNNTLFVIKENDKFEKVSIELEK